MYLIHYLMGLKVGIQNVKLLNANPRCEKGKKTYHITFEMNNYLSNKICNLYLYSVKKHGDYKYSIKITDEFNDLVFGTEITEKVFNNLVKIFKKEFYK